MTAPLLTVQDLSIEIDTRQGKISPVDRVSLEVFPGEALGIVGESGSGKSLTSLGIMGLLPQNAKVRAKMLQFQGQDLAVVGRHQYEQIRGSSLSMIFQDPMTSLNPCFTVGFQIDEVLRAHTSLDRSQRQKRLLELLEQVGISDPQERLSAYPHQMSGGMCQRIMIAMAIACNPKLLIADEPTTALDVTIQAQILALLNDLRVKHQMALILITHDLGVISKVADRVHVMYAGQIVERGRTKEVLSRPQHPYTEALLECHPGTHSTDEHRTRLRTISGTVPSLFDRPSGCQLHPRCKYKQKICTEREPEEVGHRSKCFFPVGEKSNGRNDATSANL